MSPTAGAVVDLDGGGADVLLAVGLWVLVAAACLSAALGWGAPRARVRASDLPARRRVLPVVRDAGLVVGTLLVAVHLTDDALPLGDRRVATHAETAVALLDAGELDTERLEAALSVVSEASFEVDDVTDEQVGSFDLDEDETYWQVSGPLGGEGCVLVTTRASVGGYGQPLEDARVTVTPGSCDDA